MGMFDSLTVLYPLPDLPIAHLQDAVFLTKSLDCAMGRFTLTEGGQLVHHKERWEEVPEDERPLAGQQAPMAKLLGSIRAVPEGDEVLTLTGDLRFYTSLPPVSGAPVSWIEFLAFFDQGRLILLRRTV